jgi:hypothetical protein
MSNNNPDSLYVLLFMVALVAIWAAAEWLGDQ